MLKHLRRLLLIAAMCVPWVTQAQCPEGATPCSFTVVAHDSYGDGWNGNGFNVYQHDSLIASVTLATGSFAEIDVLFCPGDSVTLTWESGLYASEVSCEVFNGNGDTVVTLATATELSTGDVVATFMPLCTTCPKALDFQKIYAAPDSLIVSWVGNEVAMEWILGIGDTVFYSTSDTFYVFEELLPGQHYNITIRPNCGDGDTGAVVEGHFFTSCVAMTAAQLPYTEDFENWITGSTGDNSWVSASNPCWSYNTNYVPSGYHYPYAYNGLSHSGSNSLYMYKSGSDYYACFILPEFETPIDSLGISMWLYNNSYTGGNSTLQVGVITNPDSIETFIPMSNLSVNALYTWELKEASFSGYTGEGGRIAIMVPNSSNYCYTYVDDIVVDYAPSCPHVENVRVQPGTTSLIITWDSGSYGSGIMQEYAVAYRDTTSSTWTEMTTTNNFVILAGLASGTDYEARVATVCEEGDTSAWSYILSKTGGFSCASADLSNPINDTLNDGTSTDTYFPSYSLYEYSYTQQIYPATELQSGMLITSISMMPNTVYSQRDLEIYLGHTSETTLSDDFIHPSDLTLVYQGGNDSLTENQWAQFELSTPFMYNGSDNLVVAVRDMTGSWTSSNQWYVYPTTTASRYIYRDGTPYDIDDVTGGYSSNYRNNIVFNGYGCTSVATCAPPNVIAYNPTLTSVDIDWAPGSTESSWDIYYKSEDDTAFTYETTVTSGPYTLSNLFAGTGYTIRVSHECDNVDYYADVNFRSSCPFISELPYVENFDSMSTGLLKNAMPCWAVVNTYSYYASQYPSVSSGESYTEGGNSIYIYQYLSGYHSYFALNGIDTEVIPMDSINVSFKLMSSNSSYQGFIVVGVMSDNRDFNTFEAIDTVYCDSHYEWENMEVSLESYNGEGNYIAFAVYQVDPNNYYDYIYIDNIELNYLPECRRPRNFAMESSTQTSATISWVGNASAYEVEYGPKGFALGTGTTIYVNDTVATITGLTDGTRYNAFVRAICGAGDTSTWSVRNNFNTECYMISSLPWTETFNEYSDGLLNDVSVCWMGINTYGTSSYPHPSINSTNNVSPADQPGASLYMYSYFSTSASYELMAVSPVIDTTAVAMNNMMVSFYVATTTSTYSSRIVVGSINTNGDISSFTPIDTVNVPYGEWGYVDIPVITSAPAGNNRIALRMIAGPNDTYTYGYIWIDDFTLDTMPSCMHPYNFRLANVGQTSVDLAWDEYGTATEWIVSYDTDPSFMPENGTQIVVTNTPSVSISNLTGGQDYYFCVRSVCSNTDSSVWVGRLHGVPNTYVMQANATDSLSLCGGVIYDDGGAEGTYSGSQDSYLTIYPDQPGYVVVLSGISHTEGNYDYLRIYDGTSDAAPELWNDYGVSSTQTFGPLVSSNGPITIYFHSDASVFYDGFEIHVDCESNSCPGVQNVRSEVSGINYVSLDWDQNPDVTPEGWEVMYTLAGDDSVISTVFVTEHPVIINGLAEISGYDFRVRPVCGEGDTGRWSSVFTGYTAPCDNAIGMQVTDSAAGTSSYLPMYSYYNYSISQQIIYASEIDSALQAGAEFSGISFYATGASPVGYNQNTTVYLSLTTDSDFEDEEFKLDNLVPLYFGDMDLVPGWNTFYFDSTFAWDGTSNIIVTVNRANGVYASDGAKPITSDTVATAIYDYNDNNAYDVTGTVTIDYGGVSYGRSIMKLVYCGGPSCMKPAATVSNISYASADLTWTGDAPAYQVSWRAVTDPVWGTDVDVNTNNYSLTGLTPATDYMVRVRAICDPIENLESDWTMVTFTTDSLPCFAPSNFANTAVEMTTASFSWTSNGEETAWRIRVWNANFDETYDVTTNPATVTGLAQYTTYSATVVAVCGGGLMESEESNVVEFTTAECPIPTDVAATNVDAHNATITWNGSASVYSIEYGRGNFATGSGTLVENISGTSYTITGLSDGVAYSVQVRAHCDAQNASAWSTRASFTTPEESGIDNVDGAKVSIYPNPTSDAATISLSGVNGEVTVTVVDMNGRTVRTETMDCAGDCTKRMEVSGLAAGSYFVRIAGEGVNTVKKLVVK